MDRTAIENPHNNQLVLLQLTEQNTGHRTYGGEVINVTPNYVEVRTYHNLEGSTKHKVRRQDDGAFFTKHYKAWFFEPNERECETIKSRRQTVGQKTEEPEAHLEFQKATPVIKTVSGSTCLCGCGGTTKGGFFVPGHDMRLKGTLKKILKGEATKTDVPVGVLNVYNDINFIRTNPQYLAIFTA